MSDTEVIEGCFGFKQNLEFQCGYDIYIYIYILIFY